LVGTQGKYTTEQATAYLKDLIVSRLTDLLGGAGFSLLDLPSHYDEIAADAQAKVAGEFDKYGLELVDFFINAITPPEEVQKAIDARSAMGAVGDLGGFMKYQTAQSMSKMAEQGGAGGSGAMGLGMGAGFGMMLPGMIREALAASPAAPPERQTSRPSGTLDFGDLQRIRQDPKQLIRTIVEAASYPLTESGDTWQVTVPVDALRKQRVTIEFGRTDNAGNAIVSMWSICGPAAEQNALSLLRYNDQLLHGAFSVRGTEAGEMVVLQANFLADTLGGTDVTQTLSALAWQADKAEEKLLGGDQY
jgi:hypothetical protein